MEIILNPEIEILDENDRHLYWLMRQSVDTIFLKAIKTHFKEKDHCYNVCFDQYANMRQFSLKQTIDEQSQHYNIRAMMEQIVNNVNEELIEALINSIAVYRECERRGIKIK
jgi:hypothetical protein